LIDGKLQLTLAVVTKGESSSVNNWNGEGDLTSIDEVIDGGARAALEVIDPIAAALYHYNHELPFNLGLAMGNTRPVWWRVRYVPSFRADGAERGGAVRAVVRPLGPQRFRPDILIDACEAEPFPEDRWAGAILHMGTMRCRLDKRDKDA
jgi:hypothetical protein